MERGRMKKDQSCLFIRKRLISGRENKEAENYGYPACQDASILGMVSKDKDPLRYIG